MKDIIKVKVIPSDMKPDDAFLTGWKEGYNQALKDIVAEFKSIDDCDFAMYSLCLVKEVADKLKGGN